MTPRSLVCLLLGCAIAASCANPQPGRSSDQARGLDAVSQIEPRLEALPEPAPPLRSAPPVASQGDCAPKYAIGLRGTCINGQPCRGFGTLTETGQPVCTCYVTPGGCSQSERCDAVHRSCVPESRPGWGAAPDD